MSLVVCSHCRKQVSAAAPKCPNCGRAIRVQTAPCRICGHTLMKNKHRYEESFQAGVVKWHDALRSHLGLRPVPELRRA